MEKERYIYTMDPYPQQSEDQNKLYKFYQYLREGKLCTTKCKNCGHFPWPPRTICPECISDDLDWVELNTEGTIYAFTIQVAGVPAGFKAPLVYAVIDLGQGIRILTPLVDTNAENVTIGSKVELSVMQVPNDRVLPAFKLK